MRPSLCLGVLLLSFPLCASAAVLEDLSSLAARPANDAAAPKTSAPAPLRDWTVMYFVNGKNNLEAYAMIDTNQMELAGSTDRVAITAELGRMNGQSDGDDHTEANWTGVRRYLITKDADTSKLASPVLQNLGKADMGSWRELVSFINWSKTTYPARRYALVLWDHGNGWKAVDPANSVHFYEKGFSLDEETGHEISTPQIALALRAAGGVNFLMLDGCNMAMASVAYEVKDLAETLTASEETEPGMIVRYAQFLGLLNAKPSMGAAEFAVNTVRTYRDYFTTGGGDSEGSPATQSALRLPKLAPFRAKLDAWAAAAMKAEPAVLKRAKKDAKIFGEEPEYKDLYDFVELVGAGTADAGLKALGQEVLRFMKTDLVLENWSQDAVSHGLSIYIPDVYDPLYDGLAWAREGAWDDFARFMAANHGDPAAHKPPKKK